MGRIVSSASASASNPVILSVSEAVAAGDLLNVTDQGIAIKSQVALVSTNNVTTSTALQGSLTSIGTGDTDALFSAVAAAIERGFTVTGPHSSLNTYVNFQRYDLSGVAQGPTVNVDISGTVSVTRLYSLADGTFVVAYKLNSATLYLARYSATGVQLGATVNLNSAGTADFTFDLIQLNDGTIVVAVINSSAAAHYRYTSSLVFLGGANVAGGSSPQRPSLILLADGSYVLIWTDGFAKFARYNAAGTLQGSVTNVSPASIGTAAAAACALPNGGFVIGYVSASGSSDGQAAFSTYDSAGILGGRVVLEATTPGTAQQMVILPNSDNTFTSVYVAASNVIKLWKHDYATRTQHAVASISSSAPCTFAARKITPNDIVVLYGESAATKFMRMSLGLIQRGPVITVEAAAALTTGGSPQKPNIVLLDSREFLACYIDAATPNQPKFGRFTNVAQSIVGVAANTVAAGGLVTANTSGSFSINQTYAGIPYAGSTQFSTQGNTASGNKGVIAGANAILQGLV